MPGTADPVVGVADDPPSVSVLVTVSVAFGLSASVSVALTAEASVADAVAVFDRVPEDPDAMVPAR